MDRVAADQALAADIASLRTDLQTMRTEFGAQITAMADSLHSTVQFALPVHFEFDQDLVRSQDQPSLDRFSQVVSRYYPGAAITVEGFADPAGSTRYNLALSQRRATAVRDYLAQKGFEGVPVRAIGYGEARPVVAGAERDMPGAELNRRVVFVIEAGQTAAQLTASAMQ
jgi:outer membrane protein OmpA-like peptidoglycan-associated protein